MNNAKNHNGETIDLAEKCEGKPNTFLCNFSGKPEKIEAFNGTVFYAISNFGEMSDGSHLEAENPFGLVYTVEK